MSHEGLRVRDLIEHLQGYPQDDLVVISHPSDSENLTYVVASEPVRAVTESGDLVCEFDASKPYNAVQLIGKDE